MLFLDCTSLHSSRDKNQFMFCAARNTNISQWEIAEGFALNISFRCFPRVNHLKNIDSKPWLSLYPASVIGLV